ncbi:hemerythrin domain-containing protein [Sphingomonas sp.]|uniref:hemerythrin domain-containing protein n=1 Tax=Sphingomonas sp. TaxID=28214 RepID=UPI003751EABF
MATRTRQPRNNDGEFASKSNRKTSGNRSNGGQKSGGLFDLNGRTAGALLSAAVAGAAVIVAASLGRKMIVQGRSGTAGDWDEVLAAEHRMSLAIFDKMLATDETQKIKRGMLLTKLTHALDKHAHEEEMVVYPALREANEKADANQLEHEHGEVKTYLFKLGEMATDAPLWLETVREFRDSLARHTRLEEDEVFPRFKAEITPEQNKHITSLVNKDGFLMA